MGLILPGPRPRSRRLPSTVTCWAQFFEPPLAAAKYSVPPSSCRASFVMDLTVAAVSSPTFTQRSILAYTGIVCGTPRTYKPLTHRMLCDGRGQGGCTGNVKRWGRRELHLADGRAIALIRWCLCRFAFRFF